MSKKLEEYTKEELIETVKSLKKNKKFGLEWEDKTEDVVEQCKVQLPVLEEVTEKKIEKKESKDANLLIEGDNYHALSVLNYTHENKIDVIYIDPPYNTGAQDWKYNNSYVDINDDYRHSKWISMMQKRLVAAKNLLKDDGVLICTIDDNEHAHLGVLLEEVFPDKEIHWITVIHNPGGIQGKNFSYTHEYAVFVLPKGKKVVGLQDRSDNPDKRPLRDVSTGDHLRSDAKNCFYPILVKKGKVIGFGEIPEDDYHPKSANIVREDGVIEIYPIDPSGNERKWVFARQSVENIIDELEVVKNGKRDIYDIIRNKTKFNYKTVWTDKKYNANIFGTKLLKKILPHCNFDFPKSLYTVEESIGAIIRDNPDAIVLDYFAGSGTTGHAALELNRKDDGNRKFILCTNNENNIAQEITYPRIQKVIEGYTDTQGIPANLRYFKTEFIDKKKTNDQTRLALVDRCTDMIRVRENSYEELINEDKFKLFAGESCNTAIMFDPQRIEEYITKVENTDKTKPVHIYIFSYSKYTYEDDFPKTNLEYQLCPIPESILEVYRRIFKENSHV